MAAINQPATNMLLTATHTQWVHLSYRRRSHGALAGQKTSPVTLALAIGTTHLFDLKYLSVSAGLCHQNLSVVSMDSALDTLPCSPYFPGLMCLSTSSKGGSLLMGAGTPWRKDRYLAYLAKACHGLSEREGFCCCCLVLCLFILPSDSLRPEGWIFSPSHWPWHFPLSFHFLYLWLYYSLWKFHSVRPWEGNGECTKKGRWWMNLLLQ